MNRKKTPLVLAIFFLVQGAATGLGISAETCLLNPPSKVSFPQPNNYFKDTYASLSLAVYIYKLDIAGYTKEELVRKYGTILSDSAVRFDLDRLNLGRKGWTRHYPFSVGGEHFIARIFLTEERTFQPEVEVLSEMPIQDPAVTVQILPGLNKILAACRIRPHNDLYLDRSTAISP